MECHMTLPLKQWQWMRQQDVKGSRWCIFDEVEKELTFFLSLPWVMTRIHFIQHHKIMSLLIYLFHHLQHKFTSLGLICGAFPPPPGCSRCGFTFWASEEAHTSNFLQNVLRGFCELPLDFSLITPILSSDWKSLTLKTTHLFHSL